MEHRIREASREDAPFVAWVQQEAARSHLPLGFWDLAFPGPEADRLRAVGRICSARARSFCHWSGFLVAEVDGRAAAALSAYEYPSMAAGTLLVDAMQEALDLEGWTAAQREAMGERVAPFMTCIPDTPEDVWVVEWVATLPEHRGKGLVRALLIEILARGRQRGRERSQISVLIGNTPAQRAYESAGFRVVEEKRHAEFERALGTPGIRRMLR